MLSPVQTIDAHKKLGKLSIDISTDLNSPLGRNGKEDVKSENMLLENMLIAHCDIICISHHAKMHHHSYIKGIKG